MGYGDSWKESRKFQHGEEEKTSQKKIEEFGKIEKEEDRWFYGKDKEYVGE